MKRICLIMLLLTWLPYRAFAIVKTSIGNGVWQQITWSPAGVPATGDSIIINSSVTAMPAGTFGTVTVNTGASLSVAPGVVTVSRLSNNGMITLSGGASFKVRGDVVNGGAISGDGSLELIASGAVISGGGTLGNVLLNIATGGVVRAATNLSVESLYVTSGNQLRLDSFNLSVRRSFTSGTPLGEPGIVATTGIIGLNGPVYGSARGSVRFGTAQMEGTRSRPIPPSTYGTFGGIGATVTFTGQRYIGFSTLTGAIMVDTGAIVTTTGIGSSGANAIDGTLYVRGTLTAVDALYLWRLNGDLLNQGLIDYCTVQMYGHSMLLRTDAGNWGHDASLTFLGNSGGELQLIGSITLPRLVIGTLTTGDTGVVVNAGHSEIIVRHQFSSDRARFCRVITDTIVKLRDAADGIIHGKVRFEGFWDSKIGGNYGGPGDTVWFAMPKQTVSPVHIEGVFAQTANARLTVRSSASVPPSTEFTAELMIDTGGVVVPEGNVTLYRDAYGGGTLELIAPSPTLDVRAPMHDSLLVRIGRDTIVSHVFIPRTFSVPRITVHPFSTFLYGAGDSVDVTRELRYRIAVQPGYAMMSAAVRPFNPSPAAVFPGANSAVYRFDPLLGYVAVDTIRPGQGYWVSFPAAGIIEQRGGIINVPFSYMVADGWNIIGGASTPANVANIRTVNTTRSSDVYAFMGGYGPVVTALPGRGYWVRFSGSGIVVLQP